jgi:hypothetical protein
MQVGGADVKISYPPQTGCQRVIAKNALTNREVILDQELVRTAGMSSTKGAAVRFNSAMAAARMVFSCT